MEELSEKTLSDLVRDDYRRAEVFEKYNLDFCCGGKKTLTEACQAGGTDIEAVIHELDFEELEEDKPIRFMDMEADQLADYIVQNHHRYVEENIPVLLAYLDKVYQSHGSRHPEMGEVLELFRGVSGELTMHMKKEELMLFPFISQMAKAARDGEKLEGRPHFGTVENPVAMMTQEHDEAGECFAKIAELTQGYMPPRDACNTYRVSLAKLQEFENDLHFHIHLENNILFPKALAMEKELVAA